MLKSIFMAGLNAVSGKQAVYSALERQPTPVPTQIIAVGKAASQMALGACEYFQCFPECLIISKYEHIDGLWQQYPQVTTIEAAHPLPDQQSLLAGACLLETVKGLDKHSRLLLLISGGASAVAECLAESMSLTQLQQLTETMLSSGKTISQINQARKRHSLVKDGKLLSHFVGEQLKVMLISDVQGDDIEIIGSGIGSSHRLNAKIKATLVATNRMARQAVAMAARQMGQPIRFEQEDLYGDVFELAITIAEQLKQGSAGVYIYGGEPTVVLPAIAGKGGRSQSLALALALELKGHSNIEVIVAGTDGTDGPTDACGAMINGDTVSGVEAQAVEALQRANAYEFLAGRSALIKTGPTGTNVMDLLIAIVS